jgi:hypothetical protein
MSLPGYDAWLERPYERAYADEAPEWVYDLLGREFWYEGQLVKAEGCEAEGDETLLIARIIGKGRTLRLSEGDVREALASQQNHRGEE